MFKALMGGGRSSSDSRSNASAKSSSSRRRADSKASSTVSRKSARGDDRDRGLGDLSAYPSSGSRSKRYASSAAGDSVASSYATADPGFPIESDRIVERTPRRTDVDDADRSDRYRDTADRSGKSSRRRERVRSPSRERERTRPVRDDPSGDADDRGRNSATSRPERRRTHSGDPYPAPPGPAPGVSFAADVMATPSHQFPGMTTTMPGAETAPTVYDPHVQQQFPGQFPAYVAEPYRPPNPAGEAADYYGDQGQSVAEQPGVRPQPPLVIPNSQAHLMTASPVDNPPPEPSSMGQVGAAAAYYDNEPGAQAPPQPNNPPSTMPANPAMPTAGLAGPAVGVVAAYPTGHGSSGAEEFGSPHAPVGASPSTYAPAAPPTSQNPPYKPSHSHGTGAAVGAAAAGAAAGYFLGHQHSSSSPDHVSQYTMQNPDDVSLNGIGHPGPALYSPNANAPPYAAAGYAAHPSHPHHAAVYHGAPFPAGGLAFQQRQRGPLSKFIDFWRDPEGVGMYEDYTETIGVCKYCFEPGTTSRDAPRKHHYRSRRRSSDRYSNGSRVDKLSRYASSEDESRRRRKSRNSWLPGVLTGYAVKSLFNNKDFDDSYSVRTGQVVNSSYDSESVSTRRSRTSRGVYRRSSRSRSRDRKTHHSQPDLQMTRTEEYRTRSRSRSRSSSRSKHTLRDAALGAAIGTAAMSVAKSRDRSRSRSPRKGRSRKSSSSDSSFVDISRPARKSVAGGFGSFFTASSDNRKKRRPKKRRGIFSFNNSSSSSVDNDLAFGAAYAKRPTGKSKKGKKKDRDVDAALLGLGAAATALAATSHRRGRRRGEILAGKGSRSGPSDYASSATNDEGWEDLDSADQSSSSVSSALAFGESGRFGGDDSSHSSDSSTSLWGWRWGSKKSKKDKKKSQKKDYLPAAAAVGAGALGAAALSSGRHRDSKTDSRDARTSSTGSLQQVAPIPTSDPSRFETVNVSSLPPEPAYVRPGPIPLQQPQPVTPVSQAVYTSQGESIHAYSAPAGPPMFDNTYGQSGYGPRATDPQWNITSFPEGPSNISRPHRRSDSSPVPHTEPLDGVSSTSLKRHSTLKEQPSVQFDLTHEQEEKERRAARLERSKRDSDRYDGVQLIDRESEHRGERESRRYDDGEERHHRERDYDDKYDRDLKEKDSSSWVGAAAAGTIGAAAAAAVLSRTSRDDSSESSQRRHDERRQKRRAERRRMTDESSVGSIPMSDEVEEHSYTKRERSPSRRSTYPKPARPKPTYENYADFFAPEELRYSPDTYARREPSSMPTIIEAVPASERSQFITEEPHPDYTNLPWPVPSLKITEPTPPQSLSGSVRDATSPIPSTPEVIPEDKELERETTGSRVSWGKHEFHEYEVPSTSSDHDSLDREPISPKDASPVEEIPRSTDSPRSKSAGNSFGTDIEFAATVAAATAAAGFDPSIITEDPVYHTRSSPPGSEKLDSWTEIVPHRDGPRGFVEGEVDTPQEKFIESEPLYAEPDAVSRDDVHEWQQQQRPSIAQEVIAQLSQKREPEAEERNLPESSPEQDYSMPGGFGPDTSRERVKDDTRSVVSAPMPGDFEDDSRRTHDFEVMDNTSIPATEEGAAEGKKKRRKRRSKRDSGDLVEDSVSVTSSPARIGEADDRSKREEEKEKKAGGFLSNLFGSRVSEPVESKKSSSDDGRVSREVQSEIGPRTFEESRRRRKEKSSSQRSSGHGDRLDDEFALEDTPTADKENINVERYKSSRQRREERRRQRHEGILDSDKGAEAEKDREISQAHDEQPFSEGTRELAMTVDDGDHGILQALSLGQGERQIPVSEEVIKPSSRATSPEPGQEQDGDEDAGQRSRRSSILRSTESPTAVPLHFRRPPTSPGTPSATSPVSPSTGSPTQTRHRRPNSTEFKYSREIRPLWLVERHGVAKMEPQEDEPLPSLPSSKTSSANASVEDLTALPDEKSWEQVDLSHYVHGTRDLDLASPRGHDSQYDILDSQQGTPTAAVFAHHHPPSRKDQLKYEFHSPSELLQDPSTYAELPPSPTLGALPSAEGSAVGVRDEVDLQDLPPLPSSRPSTPEDKMITMDDVDDTTPTQSKITPIVNRSASPTERDLTEVAVATAAGGGLASLIGAAAEKQDAPAAETKTTPEPLDKNISDAPASEFVPGDREVPESPASAVFVDAPSAAVADSGDESAFQTPVDAPLASPEEPGPTSEVPDQEASLEISRETQPQVDLNAAAQETKPAEFTNDIAAQPEDLTETSTSSKKKKKKDKKKKNKAAEQATQDMTLEDTSAEHAPVSSEETPKTAAESAVEDQPSEPLPAPEPTTELEKQPPTEPMTPEEVTKTVVSSNVAEEDEPIAEPEAADAPADTAVSSKKAKRDKKKKKKSQGPATDEATEPAPAESGVSSIKTVPEEKLDNTEEQRVEDTPNPTDEFLTPNEERSKSPVLEGEPVEEIPPVEEAAEQPETESMTREFPAADDGLQASTEPATTQEAQETATVPVDSVEIERTVAEEGTDKQVPTIPGEQQPPTETEVTSTEPKYEATPQEEQPTSATIQERQVEPITEAESSTKGLDAEPEQGVTSTEIPAISDQTEPSPDSEAPTQDSGTDAPEADTSLSRKSSKKKKKNKKKAAAEAARETTEALPAVPSGDATPTAEAEPTSPGKVDLETTPEEPSENKEEIPADAPQPEEPETLPEVLAESVAQEPAKEVTPEEPVEESTLKKKKKKKNRKSAASLTEPEGEPTSDAQPEHQPESQPEAGPEHDATATPPHEETGGELPQTATDVEAQALPEPATDETQQEPAAAENVDTIPAIADEELTQQPVETAEANDGTPHVSEQATEQEAGETASTDKKSKKKKKKKGSVSSPVDESMASTESRSLDATAEPANVVSMEPESQPQAEPEPEPSSISQEPEAEQEQREEKPAEGEASPEPAANAEETAEPTEPAVPMTAAQKKKAKKEKKKKRQSALLEEATAEQAAEAVPTESNDASVEAENNDTAPTEEPAPVAEPAPEEPKDQVVTEAEPIEQEATLAPTDETEQSVSREVTEELVAEEPIAAEPEAEKEHDETPVINAEAEAKQEPDSVTEPGKDESHHQDAEPTVSDEPTTMRSEAQPEVQSQQNPEKAQPDAHEPTIPDDSPEQPVEEAPKAEAEVAPLEEEVQPAPSAKSKKDKKKKKKRQSLVLEEDLPAKEVTEAQPPETPVEPADVSESKVEVASAEPADKSGELGPTLEDIAKDAPQEPEPQVEEPAPEVPSQDPPVPVETQQQQQQQQQQQPEAAEEPQPAMSKKQAKKEKKKKRKSVSFATEEPESQALESTEGAVEPLVSNQESSGKTPEDQPVEKGPDDSASTGVEAPQSIEPAPAEGPDVTTDVSQEQEEPITPADNEGSAAEPGQDIVTEEPAVTVEEPAEQPTQIEADVPRQNHPGDAMEEITEESPKADVQAETETVQEPTSETPAEAGDKVDPEPTSEQAAPEPETPVDTEPEATTSKSKKDKKKKKKQKALELSEDVTPASEPQVEEPQPLEESEKPDETPATETNNAEGTTDSAKSEETPQLAEEPRPEMTEEQPKEPETVDEPQQQAETQEENKAVSEAEPSAAPDEPQPSVPEEETQNEAAKDAMASMSAKERRKAKKKEKKRQSKNLDVEPTEAAAPTLSDGKPQDETPAADDTTRDTPVEEVKPADEQSSLETAIAPAEDHGKDSQSHGTDMHADTDKDMIWTDEMVSSQVEQQQHQSLPQATSSESPLPPVRDVEGGVATPGEEIKAVDENVDESGVAGEVVGRDLPAGGVEVSNQDEARRMMEAVVHEGEGWDAPPEQADEHGEREERTEDAPSGDDKTEPAAEPPLVTEEAVAQEETVEDQMEKEQPIGLETATSEPVPSSKKKSKKEKKKQRQAQKAMAAAEEEPSGGIAKEIGEPAAAVEASEPVHDQLEAPEEKVSEREETEPPASAETSGHIVEGSEKEAESTIRPDEVKMEEAVPVLEDEAPAGEPREIVEGEEPTKEMEATEVEAEPVTIPEQDVEAEQTNDVELVGVSGGVEKDLAPVPESISEPPAEAKSPAKDDLDAITAEPPENQPEESPVPVEEPTLSRKESKKKKKKAKKQAKEQEISEPVPVRPSEDEIPADTESTQLKDSGNIPEVPKTPVEDPTEGPEQPVEETGPTVSLDPFEIPPEEEKDRGVTTEPDEHVIQDLATDVQGKLQDEEPKSEETEARLRAQALEKGDDLEMAGDLIEGPSTRPETEVLVTKKLSKKEKRKAKQQAKLEAPEPAQGPEAETKAEVEEQQPQEPETLPAENSVAEDPLLSRKLSKKEKKKRKGKSADENQTTEQPAESTTQDEDAWPTIDWEKGQVDTVEKTPQSSPEAHHVTPFEPAITEFDESAIPEGVSRHADESTEDKTRGSDIILDVKEEVREASAPDMTQEVPVEAKEISETTEPVTEPVADQFLHDVTASVPEKRRMDQADVLPHKQSKVASIFPHLERGLFKRPTSTESLRQGKDGAEDETVEHKVERDSAIPVSEAPISTPPDHKDSGNIPFSSSEQGSSQIRETTPQQLEESATPDTQVVSRSINAEAPGVTPLYAPTPIHEQTSTLVSSSPVEEARQASPDSCDLRRSPSIHGRHNHPPRSWSLEEEESIIPAKTPPPPPSLGPSAMEASPPRTPLHTIAEDEADGRVERTSGSRTMGEAHGTPRLEMRPEHVLPRPQTPVRKFTDNALDRQRWPTPDPADDGSGELEVKKRGLQRGLFGSAEVLKTPDQGMPILRPSSVGSIASSGGGTRSLRRTNRSTSGDLRAAATRAAGGSPQPPASPPQPTDLSVEHIPSSSSYDPLTDKGKRPLRSMTDVYEGWGETPSSPRSPSRPPSVRHRRSMQHLQELESRLDQLISENRLLIAARDAAEDKLRSASVARRKSDHALNTRDADLRDREAELEQLKNSVDWLQKEVSRLTQENEGLSTSNSTLTATHAAEIQSIRESSSRELEVLRYENQQLSTDLHEKIRQQIDAALTQKNTELRRLREELEGARDKVKELQQQIAASMHDNVIVFRDEDYFDAACQKLCGHVQQWVLRFSKHSDHHRCRKLIDLQDEKIADRFDNAILDGSDADIYLADRVRRRDVFMSVVMTMVWEFIFTRYLFGMDREQRQKLKSLEKQLAEVGPRAAIHRWRATTLTLLAKRPAFARQRESDTEAVALEIFDTLSRILPPPSHVEAQLLESLRKVLRVAVNLSIEMRTQLAEYIMLPPLQPEYDTNGDLSRQVYFNASLMNERSGETTSNEELESQQAVVRVVLFPLVVKKGNDSGEGDDEVVVCPAQVLIARPGKDKKMGRMLSSDRMSLDAAKSVHSIAPSSTMDMSNVV